MGRGSIECGREADVRNPLKNEETAFRFVLGTIAYLALIVVASWIATWPGVVVFVVLTTVPVVLLRGGAKPPPASHHVQRADVEDTRRILVVANETLTGLRLRDEIVRMADGVAEDVYVVCPALNSQLRTWTSDEDGAGSHVVAASVHSAVRSPSLSCE